MISFPFELEYSTRHIFLVKITGAKSAHPLKTFRICSHNGERRSNGLRKNQATVSHRRKIFPADLPVPADVHLLENLFDFARDVLNLAVPMTSLFSLMPMPASGGRAKAEVILSDMPLHNSKELLGGSEHRESGTEKPSNHKRRRCSVWDGLVPCAGKIHRRLANMSVSSLYKTSQVSISISPYKS